MKILVAPDSFKGTLSAAEAAQAMVLGIRRVWPQAQVVMLPLADGGEGTVEALLTSTGGQRRTYTVTGPLGTPVSAQFGLLGSHPQTAIVEMAQAAGLGLVPLALRDPRRTTTYGVGELLRAAVNAGATRILVGLGGSATNDGGAGAMAALGARFLDVNNAPLPPGGAALARLAHIDLGSFSFPTEAVSVIAASDVRNPLIGSQGASAIYGPQKGADAAMVAELDAALRHYAQIVWRDLGCAVADLPGAGAAGGLGAALAAFLHAEFQAGIDVVLDAGDFDAQARDADWVLTGEGKLDRQTLSGKVIAGLLARCRRLGVPLVAFAGVVEPEANSVLREQGLFAAISLVTQTVSEQEALHAPAQVLENAVAQALPHVFLN